MSLSHRDRGSKNRSGSRKTRKLGERVIQRGEPVSGYGERRPRDPRDRSEEPGSQAASGSAIPGGRALDPAPRAGRGRAGLVFQRTSPGTPLSPAKHVRRVQHAACALDECLFL